MPKRYEIYVKYGGLYQPPGHKHPDGFLFWRRFRRKRDALRYMGWLKIRADDYGFEDIRMELEKR